MNGRYVCEATPPPIDGAPRAICEFAGIELRPTLGRPWSHCRLRFRTGVRRVNVR